MLTGNNKRPVFLTLYQIRLPVTAVLSIFHRVFGVIMVIAIPFLIYQLDKSVTSEQAYDEVVECLSSPWLRVLTGLLAWFFIYHLLAGIRFLILDLDIGTERVMARNSAWLVYALALLAAVALMAVLL
ncbi:MAG TPA: succinate dehydrogenase, cytochrome b556 subunit [Gammaproteobacteria bacterium]|nr:succinate dehydrogenase, cytochrome b556 subunit [Gammaproteobacteria bacterium]